MMMNRMARAASRVTASAGALALCATLGLSACASSERPGLAPVPEGLQPRPMLSSVPSESVRVAVFQGGADVSYDLVKGQRYFLVDESADNLLTSGIAEEDTELSIGEDGAEIDGDDIWEGTVSQNNQIGLYVNRKLEAL